MFNLETNGYKKQEVDVYISNLKAELLEKKLNLLDSEKKLLDLKQKNEQIEQKEKSILNAIKSLEEAQKIQEKGVKNIYELKSEQSVMIYNKVQTLISNIKSRHPEILSDKDIGKKINEVEDIIDNAKIVNYSEKSENVDPMRALLNKMQQYRMNQEPVKVVKVERNNIKHVCDGEANTVDDFLAQKPEEKQIYKNIELQSNGFDLKEAVNPKEDLSEIMKAFDFYNNES